MRSNHLRGWGLDHVDLITIRWPFCQNIMRMVMEVSQPCKQLNRKNNCETQPSKASGEGGADIIPEFVGSFDTTRLSTPWFQAVIFSGEGMGSHYYDILALYV